MTEFLLPAEMSRQIPSGCKLGLPPDGNGVSPGMIRHLIQAGVSDLHIVCAPIGGLATDMLIGAGAVSAVETSAVSLGAAGGAPASTGRSNPQPSSCSTRPVPPSWPA